MLKLSHHIRTVLTMNAAASARLCVETPRDNIYRNDIYAAASARLCVETMNCTKNRLNGMRSRLRATVC